MRTEDERERSLRKHRIERNDFVETVEKVNKIIDTADDSFRQDLSSLLSGMLEAGVNIYSPGGSFPRRLYSIVAATDNLYIVNGKHRRPPNYKELQFSSLICHFSNYYRRLSPEHRGVVEKVRRELGRKQNIVNVTR